MGFDEAMKILDDYYEGTGPRKRAELACSCCGSATTTAAEAAQ